MRGKRCFAFEGTNLAPVTMIALMVALFAAMQAQAQTYTVLHAFDWNGNNGGDGDYPYQGLLLDEGHLYGTTEGGGQVCANNSLYSCGAIWELDTTGHEKILYTFKGGSDGGMPVFFGPPIRDSQDNLYGTTTGTADIPADSTVWKLDSKGQETVLVDLTNVAGSWTDSPVIRDAEGALYGTLPYYGKAVCSGAPCGGVFKVDSKGHFSLVHVFKGTDGSEPTGGLVLDAKTGSVYGVTQAGGNMDPKCQFPGHFFSPPGCGTIFRIDKNGKHTILYRFRDKSDGAAPIRLIEDDAGNLYGIAQWGANNCWRGGNWGCGTFFKLDPKGKFSVIFAYSKPSNDPTYSQALVRDKAGNLYGFKLTDGAYNNGYIYKLTPSGKFEDLYDIYAPSRNGQIGTGLAIDSSGTLYGTMYSGGDLEDCSSDQRGCGTVFKFTQK